MTKKTPEELETERAEAHKEIEEILNHTRPKNFAQGLSTGISDIVVGTVGAAGVAVLLPIIGLVAGLQTGGLLGGVVGGAVGVTSGAVAGVLGAATLAVGGALTGAAQIVRGAVAVPQSIVAPRQGKWWNESQGKWVLTDMDAEKGLLESIPRGDEDILGKFQRELDAAASAKTSAGVEFVDIYYYECLEIPADAEQPVIKRQYYLLARRYHPDNVSGRDWISTEDAADKFKSTSEAYQVLSDPKLRAKYDKEGREGLSAGKTTVAGGAAPKIDPFLLYSFLFGSDKFTDYIGRLSTATAASVGDMQKISLDDAKTLHKRRVIRLALKMIEKITPWVEEARAGKKHHIDIETMWKEEAADLSKASYGYQLVSTIGKIYNLLGVIYEGSIDSGNGLPSVSEWAAKEKAGMDKRSDASKNQHEAMQAGFDIMKIQADLQRQMQKAITDEEREALEKKLEASAFDVLLRVLWSTAVVDITSAIKEAMQMVFFDISVDKDTRKYRAAAVEKLGAIWMDVAEPETSESEEAKDAKQLCEEAAFAALLETVKCQDESAYCSH